MEGMRTIRILLSLFFATSAFAAADLQFRTVSPNANAPVEPGAKVTYSFALSNYGDAAALLPVLTMPLPPGAHLIGVNTVVPTAVCSETNGVVTCVALPVNPRGSGVIVFDVTAPMVGGSYPTTANLSSSTDPKDDTAVVVLTVFRDFTVTSTADTGSGSLRQTILDTNEVCVDAATCRVHFNLGAPLATITPLTPLPAITSCSVTIDGGTKDVTPDFIFPRRVALSGSELKEGNGLVVSSSCATRGDAGGVVINGLAIHSFPENGILVSDSVNGVSITRDFIGLDATGTIGMGNRLRGVAAFTSGGVSVNQSNISGNGRSGVYFWSAADSSVGASRLFHNGACGIFTRIGNVHFVENEIAHNGGFGIAVARGTVRVLIDRNIIYENTAIGIDRGLDSLSVDDPLIPNAPVITDSTYDAASNETRVAFQFNFTPEQATNFGSILRVQIFASTKVDGWGRSDADRLIAIADVFREASSVVRVRGDFRGQTITAMANVYHLGDDFYGDATEISNGVVSH